MGFQFRLLTENIEKHLLKEVGQGVYPPLPWFKTTDLIYYFYCDINGKNIKVDVDFEKFRDKQQRQEFLNDIMADYEECYNLVFHINGTDKQDKKTNIKTLLVIMSTVMDILKVFIQKFNPDCILIKSTEKEISSKTKYNLYKAYIDHNINKIEGYSYQGGNKGHLVVKQNLKRIKEIHYGK